MYVLLQPIGNKKYKIKIKPSGYNIILPKWMHFYEIIVLYDI